MSGLEKLREICAKESVTDWGTFRSLVSQIEEETMLVPKGKDDRALHLGDKVMGCGSGYTVMGFREGGIFVDEKGNTHIASKYRRCDYMDSLEDIRRDIPEVLIPLSKSYADEAGLLQDAQAVRDCMERLVDRAYEQGKMDA